jgi:5-methylcytosine-specific restriction protein A
MNLNKLQEIQRKISYRVGLSFRAEEQTTQNAYGTEEKTGSLIFDFRPELPEYPSGYLFRVTVYSKRYEIQFIPDSYALPLIREMERNAEGRLLFSKMAKSLTEKSTRLSLRINDQSVPPEETGKWGSDWKELEILMEKYSSDFDIREIASIEDSLVEDGSKFFSLVIVLMPTEEAKEVMSGDAEGLPEGAKMRVEVNKYERNPLNRSVCISFHGVKCAVCNFNFEDVYGPTGMGFIHVHHITPVSELGENYVIDPVRDLVPVCPNCHAMLHRSKSPLTVEQLKKVMAQQQKK